METAAKRRPSAPFVAVVGVVDAAVTSLLWGLLALALIRFFSLQQHWYWVCLSVAVAMGAQQYFHQNVAFPIVLRELGYEVTEAARARMKFRWTECVVFAALLFCCAYIGVSSGRL